MNRRLSVLALTLVLGLVGVSGCRNCCRRVEYTASSPPCCNPCPPGRLRPFHALTPRRFDGLPGPVPPPRTDVLGPPAATLPGIGPGAPPVPPVSPAPGGPSPSDRYDGPPPVPPPEPSWKPSPDANRPPPPPDPPRDGARLYPPESPEPPQPPSKPGPSEERPPAPPLPVGIPQFAMARNRVASGLQPSVEGLDWLRDNGYRTVLFLRRPGEDDVAHRRQVEARRGMKYASLELSPQNLREVVDQFNHLASDVSCLPLFVYDRDGGLQGFLWYLHFRIVDLATDDEARIRAGRLGLREPQTDEQRAMWLAVQKYLSR